MDPGKQRWPQGRRPPSVRHLGGRGVRPLQHIQGAVGQSEVKEGIDGEGEGREVGVAGRRRHGRRHRVDWGQMTACENKAVFCVGDRRYLKYIEFI